MDSLVRQKKMIVKVIFRRYNRIHENKDKSRFGFNRIGQAKIP